MWFWVVVKSSYIQKFCQFIFYQRIKKRPFHLCKPTKEFFIKKTHVDASVLQTYLKLFGVLFWESPYWQKKRFHIKSVPFVLKANHKKRYFTCLVHIKTNKFSKCYYTQSTTTYFIVSMDNKTMNFYIQLYMNEIGIFYIKSTNDSHRYIMQFSTPTTAGIYYIIKNI